MSARIEKNTFQRNFASLMQNMREDSLSFWQQKRIDSTTAEAIRLNNFESFVSFGAFFSFCEDWRRGLKHEEKQKEAQKK